MSKIEKIRAEIERRLNILTNVYDELLERKDDEMMTYYHGKVIALEELRPFLYTLSEDSDKSLEEEIRRYYREECSSDDEPTTEETARHFYELGKQAMKQQMLKEAVEGKVYFQMGGIKRVKSDDFENPDIYFGDKVKLIIVKED